MFQGNRSNCILITVIIISHGCWQKIHLYFLIRCNIMVYFEMIAFYFPVHDTISFQYSWQTLPKDKNSECKPANCQILQSFEGRVDIPSTSAKEIQRNHYLCQADVPSIPLTTADNSDQHIILNSYNQISDFALQFIAVCKVIQKTLEKGTSFPHFLRGTKL